MAGRGLLNLTLDEIIKQQNQEKRFQFSNAYRTDGRKNFNRNLSSSLSSRLSRRIGGGFVSNVDTRINQNYSRVPSQGIQNKPIFKRLTRNTPLQRSNNAFRGKSTTNLKTRNAEDYYPVRINNGAIVKGLRSDQLLLQKISQAKNKYLQEKIERVRAMQAKKAKLNERKERSSWKSPSKVLMDVDHGLTVSFPNEAIRKKSTKPLLRTRRFPLSPPESPSSSSSSSSSEDDYYPPSTSRRVSTEAPPKDPLSSILRLGAERPPPPKPHRQVLDPTVQKEIAALQGYDEPHSVGPGPGVKGFKMMPCRTKTSLNERFTIERHVND